MQIRLFILMLLLVSPVLVLAQEHFAPVEPTGQPYSVIIDSALFNGEILGEGDEIGLFDGDLCVGADIAPANYDDWPINVHAWREDVGHELPGFTSGHTIEFRVWDSATEQEVIAEATLTTGNGTFGANPYTLAWLQSGPGDLPSAFSLVTPADSSWHDSLTIALAWTAAEDPGETISYSLYVGPDSLEHLPLETQGMEFTGYNIQVEDNTSYRWTVRAVDENSGGRWAEGIWRFQVSVPEPPPPFNLIAPGNNTRFAWSAIDSVGFAWQSAPDPDPGDTTRYSLYLAVDGAENQGPDLAYTVENLRSPSTSLTDLAEWLASYSDADSVEVDWFVKAISGPDSIVSTETYTFTVRGLSVFADQTLGLPSDLAIDAWPNPFNSQLHLRISIPDGQPVTLTMYNSLGQEVLSEHWEAGVRTATELAINASELASGAYLLRVQGATSSISRRVQLIK